MADAQAQRKGAAEMRAVAREAVVSAPLPLISVCQLLDGALALTPRKLREAELHGAPVAVRGVLAGLQRGHARTGLSEDKGVLPVPDLDGHVEQPAPDEGQC